MRLISRIDIDMIKENGDMIIKLSEAVLSLQERVTNLERERRLEILNDSNKWTGEQK